jgi:endogenous inhibitor of DNA gyrase (YacG/DUF329 family)
VTIETKHVVSLSEITGLRLECRKCGAAYVWSPSRDFDIPFGCKGCQEIWFTQQSTERAAISSFADAIRALLKGQGAYVMCMEHNPPPDRATK